MPHMGLRSFVIVRSEMGQVYNGASGIGWWGPGWKLGTCGLLEAQQLHGERVNQQVQASSVSVCSPHEGPWVVPVDSLPPSDFPRGPLGSGEGKVMTPVG